MKVKKWWAVVAGAVLGTAAVGTGAYVAKHRRRRGKAKAVGGGPSAQAAAPLDAVPAPEGDEHKA